MQGLDNVVAQSQFVSHETACTPPPGRDHSRPDHASRRPHGPASGPRDRIRRHQSRHERNLRDRQPVRLDLSPPAPPTTSARTGNYALQASPTSSDNARCTQSIPVKASTTYTLSAWVKGSNVYLGFEGGTSTWSTSTTWNQLTTTFTTSASTTRVTIDLHGWYGLPPYQADDVVLDGPGGTPDPTTPSDDTSHYAADTRPPRRPRPRPPPRPRLRLRRTARCPSTCSPATGRTSTTAPPCSGSGTCTPRTTSSRSPSPTPTGPAGRDHLQPGLRRARRLHGRPVQGRHRGQAGGRQAGDHVGRRPERHRLGQQLRGRDQLRQQRSTRDAASTASTGSTSTWRTASTRSTWPRRCQSASQVGRGSSSRWRRRPSTCSRRRTSTSRWRWTSRTS